MNLVRQMRIGSSSFVAVLWIMALVAVLSSYVTGTPGLMWSAAVVASYALHLTAVESARRYSAPSEADLEPERLLLAAEREEVARLKRELDRQRLQAEEQWELLREMVQERVNRASRDREHLIPAEERTTNKETGKRETERSVDRSKDSQRNRAAGIGPDEPSRIYGRW